MLGKSVTAVCIVILLLSVGCESLLESGATTADLASAQLSPIFNGKDLTGWEGDPNFWSVRDGSIIARVEPGLQVKNHSYLIWQGGLVKDFELRLMVRSTEGNSGIDYRAEPVLTDRDGQKLKWTIRGYQSDVAQGWMGSLYNWGKPGAQPGQFVVVTGNDEVTKDIGALADRDALNEVGYYKPGEWNEFAIVARGSHLLHRINNYLTTELIDNGPDTRKQGLLGLQVHSGRRPFLNEYKDIRIKQLATNFGQARLLFNGKNLTGWSFSSPHAKNGWMVKNGVLIYQPGTQGCIYTNKSYKDFILRFQYRRLGKRKGGVLLRLTRPMKTQQRCIRVHGEGDDFNQLGPDANFLLEMRKWRTGPVPFRRMPERFWNECEMVLNKGHLEVRVNGVLRARGTGCEQVPGRIGFEASDSRIEYRNIVLIPILAGSAK